MTLHPRALQDGQAPMILPPWWPLLAPGLSLTERVATIGLMPACLRQLPRPLHDQVILYVMLTYPPTHLPDNALIASVCVVAVGVLGFGLWLLLR